MEQEAQRLKTNLQEDPGATSHIQMESSLDVRLEMTLATSHTK